MIKEKIQQSYAILNELDVDLWLIFGRESHTSREPCADLVIGTGYTWATAFILTRTGRSIAIIGSLDAAELRKKGYYDTVVEYVGGIGESLRNTLREIDPATIAINYSTDDIMADGLTHGMYLQLTGHLKDTPYASRLVSSEKLISALRGRKSAEEIRRIKQAIVETEALYREAGREIRPGKTEQELAAFLTRRRTEKGFEAAWALDHCPAVFTGVPLDGQAHTGPSSRVVEPGHIINMDFGLKIDGYCSDLQRTWYVRREGETVAPPEVLKGFQAVVDAIAKAAGAIRPGIEGWQIDDIARQHIISCGFPEYPHALGHQVGRSPHDGAGLLCPRWERYGRLPYLKVEEGQVYTLEPRVTVPGYGVATVEEIIVVRPDGGEFLSSFQRELWLV